LLRLHAGLAETPVLRCAAEGLLARSCETPLAMPCMMI
jgi:hypothetical protein